MNVGILLVTHGDIGAILLQSATDILGICNVVGSTIARDAEL